MRQLDTFQDVAATLREAEEKREQGEIQATTGYWRDMCMSPIGFCAVGAIAYVSGMPVGWDWNTYIFLDTLPILTTEVINPEDGNTDDLWKALSTLYEDYDWSWPRLADWLEGLQ